MIRVDNTRLFNAVKAVSPITSKRQCLPILSHVLVSGNGRLELTATDLEIGIRTWIDVQSEQDFSVCLPGCAFKDMIANSAGEIDISLDDNNRAKLSSASGVQELGGMDASTYPVWMDRQGATDCTVSTKEFMSVMKKAVQSAGTDMSRFNMNGVLLDGPAGCVVATDGHRLQKIPVDWIPETVKAILPAKALKQSLSSLGNFKGVHELKLWFEEKNLWITSEVFEITIRLLEGDYPQYEKVIPEKSELDVIIVNTKEFIKALKQVKIMAPTRNPKVELWHGETMVLRCINPDLGSAQTEIDTEFHGCAGDIPERVALNVNYVLDAARKCKDDTLKLWLNRKTTCFIGEELVIPMNTKDDEFGPVPERVTGYPVFAPSGIPFDPHPVVKGLPQDEKWVAAQSPFRRSVSGIDEAILDRVRHGAYQAPTAGPKVVKQRKQIKKVVKAVKTPLKSVQPTIEATEKRTKKVTNAELNAWRYVQEENPGDAFRWIEGYTRKDGVKVRGHWRKRPALALRKAA